MLFQTSVFPDPVVLLPLRLVGSGGLCVSVADRACVPAGHLRRLRTRGENRAGVDKSDRVDWDRAGWIRSALRERNRTEAGDATKW